MPLDPPRRSLVAARAFTLIELLVVISIIALLISILLPALSAARRTAQQAQCASTARQIVLGMTSYAVDSDGYYPDVTGNDASRSWGSYAPALVGPPPQPRGLGLLWKHGYLPTWEAFYCAGRPREAWPAQFLFSSDPAHMIGEYPRASCYNLRGWEGDPTDWRMPDRGRLAVTADMFFNWYYALIAHESGINVGYSDGSVQLVRHDTLYPSGGLPFNEQLRNWSPTIGNTIGHVRHHQAYRFLDTQ